MQLRQQLQEQQLEHLRRPATIYDVEKVNQSTITSLISLTPYGMITRRLQVSGFGEVEPMDPGSLPWHRSGHFSSLGLDRSYNLFDNAAMKGISVCHSYAHSTFMLPYKLAYAHEEAVTNKRKAMFFLSQIVSHTLCGIFFQPISITWANLTVRDEHVSWIQSFKDVRAKGNKSFWDGVSIRITNTFLNSMISLVIETTLSNRFGLHRPEPWVPATGVEHLHELAKRNVSFTFKRDLAAISSAAITNILTYPLSVAQARIETQGLVSWIKPSTWSPTAFFKVFADLYKEEGISFLWRGIDQLLTGIVFSTGTAALQYALSRFILDYVITPESLKDPKSPLLLIASMYVGTAQEQEPVDF